MLIGALAAALGAGGVTASRVMSGGEIPTLDAARTARPDGHVRARFMGVTTILLDDGETRILMDGYFTRPGTLDPRIEPSKTRIETGLRDVGVTDVDAVLVAHGHYDHAMDSADVAKPFGAIIVGDPSVGFIAEGRGARANFRKVVDRQSFRCGRFKITAYAIDHGPTTIFSGAITKAVQTPAAPWAYSQEKGFAYLIEHPDASFLIQPSASFAKDRFNGMEADVVFLSVGSMGGQNDAFVRDYWRDVVQATQPSRVIPVHWDDFNAKPEGGRLKRAGFLKDGIWRDSLGILRKAAVEAHEETKLALMPLNAPVDFQARSPAVRAARAARLGTPAPPGTCRF
jgi:L-ascorbate metabolism protein UlaG (beta-lactamase superfamily)